MFQFHTGAIRSNFELGKGGYESRFNSILVRLEGVDGSGKNVNRLCVSIPYWCD